MTETERIDGRIRDLAELCTRHGTPCADGLLAEIGRLRTDRDYYATVYVRAIERFGNLGMGVMQKIADGGSLLDVLDWVGDALNECDHVDDESVALFERARETATKASTEPVRTEGDLGVAIREAAAAREALREVWRIQAKYGPWGAREKIELVVSAALDQRLAR